jgi:hypothetical protein
MKISSITLIILLLIVNMGCEKSESQKNKLEISESYLNSIDSLIFNKSVNSDSLIDYKSFVDLTPLLAPAFIEKYGKDALPHIEYVKLIFSPKGKFLAIVTEDPQQVWILDIINKRVQLAVDKWIPKKTDLSIASVFWLSDDTLVISGKRHKNRGSRYIKYHSTINGYKSEELTYNPFKVPNELINYMAPINHVSPTNKFEVMFPNKQTIMLRNFKTNKTMKFIDKSEYWWINSIPITWSALEKYFFFSWNHGHGEITLYAAITEPKFKVTKLAVGSWELEGFAVSPILQEIAYPDGRNSIFIYDLENDKIKKRIITGGYPSVIGWSVQNLLVFNAINYSRPLENWETKNDFAPWSTKRLYLIKL